MAAPFNQMPQAGADLNTITTAADVAAGKGLDARLGTVANGSTGRYFVYGKANASIPASTTVCTVNATTFLVTATGGAYTSPAVAMATGDYGWFSKASV